MNGRVHARRMEGWLNNSELLQLPIQTTTRSKKERFRSWKAVTYVWCGLALTRCGLALTDNQKYETKGIKNILRQKTAQCYHSDMRCSLQLHTAMTSRDKTALYPPPLRNERSFNMGRARRAITVTPRRSFRSNDCIETHKQKYYRKLNVSLIQSNFSMFIVRSEIFIKKVRYVFAWTPTDVIDVRQCGMKPR